MIHKKMALESQMHAVTEINSETPIAKLVSEIMTREIKTLGPDQSFVDHHSLVQEVTAG